MSRGVVHVIDGLHGQYVPQRAAAMFKLGDDRLESPDHEGYWEAWEDALKRFEIAGPDGIWRLHYDGGLFLYCVELMTDEELADFGFEVGKGPDEEKA